MQKEINVHYFALLAQEAGKERENLITSSTTLGELFEELKQLHSLSLNQKQVRAAINDQMANNWQMPISNGDQIIFIPPLAGG